MTNNMFQPYQQLAALQVFEMTNNMFQPYPQNLLAPYYASPPPRDVTMEAAILDQHLAQQLEAFSRSCSQHWLDAMLDIELGLS